MTLVCPFCRVALPDQMSGAVVTCQRCGAEVDVSRAGTAAGRPRFLPEIDRTGQVVGGFRLAGRIGAGGMGTVYRGEPAGAGAAVAVKFLTPALAGEPGVVARFEREARLLRTLEHPGIVRVVDHGSAEGIPWFAMELVDGRDLKTRLTSGPLSPAEVAAIFPPVLEALDHAHGRGIVHRDIKPAKVLLAADSAKLADFGIALPAMQGEAAMTRLTETAAVIGTLPYMSPEQRAGGTVDRRSDLFSIGVMLYEAVTGRLPQGSFPPPSRVNRAFGPALDRVVTRLLQPEPDARFLTAAEAARALVAALRKRRAARLVGAGVAAAVALTIGLGIPAVSRLRGAQEQEATRAAVAAPPVESVGPPAPVPQPIEQAARLPENAEIRSVKSKTVKLGKHGKTAASVRPKGAKDALPHFDDLGAFKK